MHSSVNNWQQYTPSSKEQILFKYIVNIVKLHLSRSRTVFGFSRFSLVHSSDVTT